MNAESRWSAWSASITIAASLSVLASHAYLGSYSRFIADDYCSAAEANRLGILRAAWFWYITWTGRYAANLADAVFGALGPSFTPAVTSLVILTWLATLGLAIYLLLPTSNKRTRLLVAATLATTILFLTLTLTVNVRQSLYWSQGMRSVVPPLILGTMYVSLFRWVRSRPIPTKHLVTWSALSMLLSYIAGGFSETYTVFQLGAFLLALGLLLILNRQTLRRDCYFVLMSGFLGAILALISVIASPGNPFRQAYFPPPPTLPVIAAIAMRSFWSYWLGLFSSMQKILALVAAFGVGISAGTYLHPRSVKGRIPLLILIFGIALIFTCFPPSAYGLSDAPPDRTLIIPTYGLVLTLAVLGISLETFFVRTVTAKRAALAISTLLILVTGALFINQTISTRLTYINYADAWSAFNAQMIASRTAKVTQIVISTQDMNMNNWSGLDVLGDNPKFWLNKCVSDYYGVEVTSNSPPP